MGDLLTRVVGDPFEVSAAGTALTSIAMDVATQARRLRSLTASDWTGVAADTAHAHIAMVPPKLDKVTASYGAAGAALGSYARALAAAQAESDAAIANTARASVDLAAAQAARATAVVADAVAARAAIAGGLPPAPATAHRYDGAIEDASARLNAARTSNDEAHDDQQRAASRAAAALHNASRRGIPNQSWWHHFTSDVGHWASTHWVGTLREMSGIAAKVAAIASVATLLLAVGGIFFPPLEIAAAAMEGVTLAADAAEALQAATVVATAVSMVSDSTLAATGEGSWIAPAEDTLNLLPWRSGTAINTLTPKIRAVGPVRVFGRFIAGKLPKAPMADFGDGVDGRRFPLGFRDSSKFRTFAKALRTGLDAAGYHGTAAIMHGSSVTGFKFMTLIPFRDESDYDIALAGGGLLTEAKELGIELRGTGPGFPRSRTEPLTLADHLPELKALGLEQLARDLGKQAGRDVSFMIYDNTELALTRSKSILIHP